MPANAPLAYRLRPQTLDEFFGQEHIVGKGTALRKAIEGDTLSSVILAGPPGTGKTTLAKIIAETTHAHFRQINAVLSGVAELKEVCAEAERVRTTFQQRTVVFIDEIHRFNKKQQDALLPYVESGAVILIGATTENPYFEVNAPLVSRSQVYLFEPLSVESLVHILRRAVDHSEGFAGKLKIEDSALHAIAGKSNGDARVALNTLELAALSIGAKLTTEQIERILKQRRRYDKTGEDHYDTISAFIKSMRGSDTDAALLWMFKMLASGEEPRFIFRRMAIFASEDVGLADPAALRTVTAAWQAFEMVGLPEGEFFLAHACVYLSQAPKSNAVTRAMHGARKAVDSLPLMEVPLHLRNAPVAGMKQQGYGQGYRYPHDDPRGVVEGHYFPIDVAPQEFYTPSPRGFEAEVRKRLEEVRKIVRKTP